MLALLLYKYHSSSLWLYYCCCRALFARVMLIMHTECSMTIKLSIIKGNEYLIYTMRPLPNVGQITRHFVLKLLDILHNIIESSTIAQSYFTARILMGGILSDIIAY